MKMLELLAPARDINIGIAAIDCGADAVYIAGPQFGARQAAGNSVEGIRTLCSYAHRYGVKIFITLNTILYESELEDAYRFMLDVQKAGADAIIVQDLAVVRMAREGYKGLYEPLNIPLHASTQCAIRTPQQARFLEGVGFSRIILERELSLDQIRDIRNAVSCELEFFVHGALCVCYSGQCYLSEMIAGRSANRGSCIQACRSRYDLTDSSGKVLVKDKALLSLKDYNLRGRLRELAEAGIDSFKIEGRLKNESYVKNVVRDYSTGIDELIKSSPDKYARASFGKVCGGFTPDTAKTFNRGYTELFLDGKRGKWAAMDAAKSMGEEIGTVSAIGKTGITVRLNRQVKLNNGDGFSFVTRSGKVEGFRADVCTGNMIQCRSFPELFVGARLFRNINSAFEKEIERQACIREIEVAVSLDFVQGADGWVLEASATSEDGRQVRHSLNAGEAAADNQERMSGMITGQIGKRARHYRFRVEKMKMSKGLPFMSASSLNNVRRTLAELLDDAAVISRPLLTRPLPDRPQQKTPSDKITYWQNVANSLSEDTYRKAGAVSVEKAYELTHAPEAELMRTKYCIRHELGMCPVHQGYKEKQGASLFLLNNGKRLALHFDCKRCEMTVTEA